VGENKINDYKKCRYIVGCFDDNDNAAVGHNVMEGGKHKTLYLTNYFKLVNLRKLHPQKNGLFESRHKKDPQPRFVKNREATIQEEELS
jgi:glycerol kinase